jgi:hypothetical protein
MDRIRVSYVIPIAGFMLIHSAFSQTSDPKNSISAGYCIGVPRMPVVFRNNWGTGRGAAIEYQSFLGRHLSFFSGLEYLAFPLNSKGLANEYNPSQSGWSEFEFEGGVFRAGVFQAGFRLFFDDASYPIALFTQAAGSLAMTSQEKMTIGQTAAGARFSQTVPLGKSESSPGVQAGFGMRVRFTKAVRFMMAAEGHCVFSSDRSDNTDAKVRQLSRAQAEPTIFIAFRTVLEYCFQ